jgi:hypothetical protein
MMFMSVISTSFELESRDVYALDTSLTRPSIVVTVEPVGIIVLPSVGAE